VKQITLEPGIRAGNLVLTDTIGNYCKIPIETITRTNFQIETTPTEKPRPSIWTICRELLKKTGVKDLVIEELVNEEYFSYIIMEDDSKIPIRPSDMIMMFMYEKDIPIKIDEKLLTKTSTPSLEGLQDQLKTAVENEDFKLAADLQKLIRAEKDKQ